MESANASVKCAAARRGLCYACHRADLTLVPNTKTQNLGVNTIIRPTDDEARQLAQALIRTAKYGAIAVTHPDSGHPHVTRIAIGTAPDGQPITLISDLSLHTSALKANSICALLLGEPGPKGDPLTHPRLTVTCEACVAHKTSLRDHYLSTHPKAQLYIDFSDFNFYRFTPLSADLNGGFGKAFHLTPEDLRA